MIVATATDGNVTETHFIHCLLGGRQAPS